MASLGCRAHGQTHQAIPAAIVRRSGHAWEPEHGNGHRAVLPTLPDRAAGESAAAERGPISESTIQIVLDQVRQIAKERAGDLTLETNILDLGLDSLERMEIVAALEETFGGRFPEAVLPQMETCREVVEAVEAYLGKTPREPEPPPAGDEIPPEHYRFDLFPEYLALKQNMRSVQDTGLANPYFRPHERVTNDTTQIDGRVLINFSSYNYLACRAIRRLAGRERRHRSLRHQCFRQPARLRRKAVHRELERAIAGFIGTARRHRLRRRPFDERIHDRPSVRPRRPDPARRPGPQQHHSRLHPVAAPGGGPFRTTIGRPLDQLLTRVCAATIAAC